MNGRSRPSQIWLAEAACQRMSQTEAFVFPSAAIHGNNLVKSRFSHREIDSFDSSWRVETRQNWTNSPDCSFPGVSIVSSGFFGAFLGWISRFLSVCFPARWRGEKKNHWKDKTNFYLNLIWTFRFLFFKKKNAFSRSFACKHPHIFSLLTKSSGTFNYR